MFSDLIAEDDPQPRDRERADYGEHVKRRYAMWFVNKICRVEHFDSVFSNLIAEDDPQPRDEQRAEHGDHVKRRYAM